MTLVEPEARMEVDTVTAVRPLVRVPRSTSPHTRPLTIRFVVLVAVVAGAFVPTWVAVGHEIAGHSPIGYLLAVPLWTLVTAIGNLRRRPRGLPIHDAETDGIVSGSLAAVAVIGGYLLAPRLDDLYPLWHADLFAAWLLAVAGSVMLLGLRPIGRFRGAWLVALLAWPLPYRVVGVMLGGTFSAYGLMDAVITALVVASLGRTWAGRGASLGAALIFGSAAAAFAPNTLIVVQLLPVLVGTLAGLLGLIAVERPRAKAAAGGKPVKLAVPSVTWRRWFEVVLIGGLALVLIPRPPASLTLSTITPAQASAGTFANYNAWPAPIGWHIDSRLPSDWVNKYYGSGATWERQRVTADAGRAAWDKFSRPRTIMVDTLTVAGAQQLSDYPVETTYPIAGNRTRDAVTVDLGHGVKASLYDSVDDERALTFTMLTINWRVPTAHGTRAQRITMISVDDHRSTASFPMPEPSLGMSVRAAIKRILRGDATTRDTNAFPKDGLMLISAGRSLVTSVVDGNGS